MSEKEKIKEYLEFFEQFEEGLYPKQVVNKILDAMPEDPKEKEAFFEAMQAHGYAMVSKIYRMQYSESGFMPTRLV